MEAMLEPTARDLDAPPLAAPAGFFGKRPGIALLNAMFVISIMTLMLVVGMNYVTDSQRASRNDKQDAQAYNIARAGLVDAMNYFKRQPTQPVQSFAPKPNPSNPPLGDTWDPSAINPGAASGGPGTHSLGLVREYPLDSTQTLYARYEVGKITKLEPGSSGALDAYSIYDSGLARWVPVQNETQCTSTAWDGVQDVSSNYGVGPAGSGLVWRIRSHGYVYRRDPSAPAGSFFFQNGNHVLGQAECVTEIRRLQLTDFLAALVSPTGSNMTFANTNNLHIRAPSTGYGVSFNNGSTPNPWAPACIQGSSGQALIRNGGPTDPRIVGDWNQVFGMPDAATLASVADYNVSDLSLLPVQMPNMALTYIKPASGTATFTQARPLNGGGILVVDGNLTLADYSSSLFAGYVYVTGNYSQSSTATIIGQVVVLGTSLIQSPSDTSSIEYNDVLLNTIRVQLGQYRERRAGMRIQTGIGPLK